MNIEKVGYGKFPDAIHAVIEIPFGSNIKYEIEKDSDAVFVDRIVPSAMFYPANYGFIPNTLAGDGDPADILVLTDYALHPGSVIKCRLIGVLEMEDEGGQDEKLLAVPIAKVDPRYDDIQTLDDLPKATLARIKNFFETYKMLEPNKWVKVTGYKGKDEATDLLKGFLQ